MLVDRSSCTGGPHCKKTRGVQYQKEIEAAVAARLRSLPGGPALQVFQGERWSVAEQAKLFRRAAAMVGPHGAGEVNLLFLQPRTPVIEYVVMHGSGSTNSALYVGYAHAFNLPYWAVVSNDTDGSYDGIQSDDVAETVVRAVQGDAQYSVIANWSSYVTLGYGDDPRTPPNWLMDSNLHQGKVWY